MKRRASCACGTIAVECEGDPVRVSMCHCLDCQKRTGSTFGVQARFARDRVSILGAPSVFLRKGDSGGTIKMSFCGKCGSTVFWEPDGLPDFVVVAVGAFADPSFPAPSVSVYDNRRHAWTDMPTLSVEKY